jgi:hypothetical protein
MQRGRPVVLGRDALAHGLQLVAETELLEERSVCRQIVSLQVREQAAPCADHLQEPSTTMMVLRMGPEVFGERVDPLSEHGHLQGSGPSVRLVEAMLFGDGLLVEAHSVDSVGVPARATSCRFNYGKFTILSSTEK